MKLNTLINILENRARESPDSVAFTYSELPYTYGEMWESIERFGAYLLKLGVMQGDRVILVLSNSDAFFAAFYGVQRMGGIAVPLFPGSGPERIFSIAELSGSKVVVVPGSIPEDQLAGFKLMGQKHGLKVVTVPESQDTNPDVHVPEIHSEQGAFIQYTSGSTGNPKGVLLSHANLLTNVKQMIAGMQITRDDIFVSWLPIYHDMGLVLMTMAPFYLGIVTHLLPTQLQDMHSWVNAIQVHQATFTAAPDFAYRLCLRRVDPGDYDLRSLRVALNAAEPVRAQTRREFEDSFGLKNVMVAGYGLAEATVGVSMWPPQTAARVDERGFVSVGPPFPDVKLKIIQENRPAPPGEVGEIAICSAANSSGYYRNPEETKRVFLEDGYLLSGDMGYLDDDGYLYIVGRKKNIIKRSGETISPQEIEEVVDNGPAVRYSAAVGVDQGRLEGEQIYIFAEIREGDKKPEADLYDISLRIVSAVHARMGFRPGRLYLLAPHTIPMTYNGKIQHGLLKTQYLDGSLRTSGGILFPEY